MSHRHWMVLADMARTRGPPPPRQTEDMHAHVGSIARDCGFDERLFARGRESRAGRTLRARAGLNECLPDPNAADSTPAGGAVAPAVDGARQEGSRVNDWSAWCRRSPGRQSLKRPCCCIHRISCQSYSGFHVFST